MPFFKRINKSGLFFLVAVLALMVAIFMFSSQVGEASDGLSVKVTRLICRVLFFRFGDMTPDEQVFLVTNLNMFVRKLAHFSVYALLGVLTYCMFMASGIKRLRIKWLPALSVCALYATADEIHQYFVPGRSMRFTDVLIDTAGAVVGMLMVRLVLIVVGYIRGLIGVKAAKPVSGT